MQETIKITEEDLVLSQFEDLEIESLHIKREINDHGTMVVTGRLNLDSTILEKNIFEKDIEIKLSNKNGSEILFKGIISEVKYFTNADCYDVNLKCVTTSFKLDMNTNRSIFAGNENTYKSIVTQITTNYNDICLNFNVENKDAGVLVVQKNETDWDFIKRMASHFDIGLYYNFTKGENKINFGKPNINKYINIDEHIGIIRKDFRQDYLECEFRSHKIFELGETVIYRDIEYFISSISAEIMENEMIFNYVITTKFNLDQNNKSNNINKTTIDGRIVDINDNNIKVQLKGFDEIHNESTVWVPYSTVFMKYNIKENVFKVEVGDDVLLSCL